MLNIKNNEKKDIRSKHKKNENFIEYHFSNNKDKKPYLDVEIPVEKIRKVFDNLRNTYGEVEIIKEYSTYKHNDLELTVFPDGSSFCRQIDIRELKDEKVNDILEETGLDMSVVYKEKHKISNDYFPCKFKYYSALDMIDVIFNVNKEIKIILSTCYENNRNMEKIKSIDKLGRPCKIRHSSNTWCELYLSIDCSCDVDEAHNTIKYIQEILV